MDRRPIQDPDEGMMKRREAYQKEHDTFVTPHADTSRKALELSAAYGQLLVKFGVALNGGALVAMPALAALFGANVRDPSTKCSLMIAVAILIVGLLTAVGTAAAGYFNFRAVFRSYDEIASAYGRRAERFYLRLLGHQVAEPEPQTASPSDKLVGVTDWLGTTCFIISVAAFLLGALIGGLAITNSPEKLPQVHYLMPGYSLSPMPTLPQAAPPAAPSPVAPAPQPAPAPPAPSLGPAPADPAKPAAHPPTPPKPQQ